MILLRNEVDVHVLTWSDIEDMLLDDKNMLYSKMYSKDVQQDEQNMV